MSYNELDAKFDLDQKIDRVLNKKDINGAHEIANQLAEADDMEGAEEFRNLAQRWAREEHDEDWGYDEAKDNNLTD